MAEGLRSIKTTSIGNTFHRIAAFRGEPGNALLAPRGACLHGDTLVVSDTGKNRVLIWKHFLFDEYQPADVILGQSGPEPTAPNGGDTAGAASLHYPSGIWTDGDRLIVADAWNHRVLIWHKLPEQHGQPADVVIGQMDFESCQPNVTGVGKDCTAHTLNWPYGVWSDGEQLWIADTGNRRVLYFHKIPGSNFSGADEVIGQELFTERDYNHENAIWPYSVKVSPDGALVIADTQYYRVLFWRHWQDALHRKAERIIGQPDNEGNGQNQYQLQPSARTLNWCYDACFYRHGLAIADTGNSRILIKNQLPVENNEAADALIGQPRFDINGESSLSMKTTQTNEMYWPFAVNAAGEILVVADTGNHQLLFYKPDNR